MSPKVASAAFVPLAVAIGACSASSSSRQIDPAGAGGSGQGGTGAGATSGFGGISGTGGVITTDGGNPNKPPPPCPDSDPNLDGDGDGYTPAQGDCRDCDPMTNPGAVDVAGNLIDEDCNGGLDDEPTACDGAVSFDGNDPVQAALAMGICRMQNGESWGLRSARWGFPDGTVASLGPQPIPFPLPLPPSGCGAVGQPPNPMSHGLLDSFGSNVAPREGTKLVAISSGVARSGPGPAPPPGVGTSPSGADMCTYAKAPPGFPKDFPSCAGTATAFDTSANDGMALDLEIKVPTNAQSCSFDVNFYTFEFPGFICSQFNDFFVALLDSAHPNTPPDRNVSFDSQGNAISVNAGFLEVCAGPTVAGNKQFDCKYGTTELQGTGFESGAATSWLRTTFSVVPGETIRLRFAIWDVGDHILDSTTLLDNFRCGPEGGNEPPETIPIPK